MRSTHCFSSCKILMQVQTQQASGPMLRFLHQILPLSTPSQFPNLLLPRLMVQFHWSLKMAKLKRQAQQQQQRNRNLMSNSKKIGSIPGSLEDDFNVLATHSSISWTWPFNNTLESPTGCKSLAIIGPRRCLYYKAISFEYEPRKRT